MLDLPEDASSNDVAQAYRTLVKVWHPDRFAHDPELRRIAQAKLQEINASHAWLEAHRRLLGAPIRTTSPPRVRVRVGPRGLGIAASIVVVGSVLSALVLLRGERPGSSAPPPSAREPKQAPVNVEPAPVVPSAGPAFSLGASRAELLRVQGTPTKVQDWGSSIDLRFGRSSVTLKHDRVVGFVNEGDLRVDLAALGAAETKRWTLGSSLADVVGTEGTPTAIEDWNGWMSLRYGRSTVKLERGRVTAYYNRGDLDVFLEPAERHDSASWAVGSSIDEVVSVEGTPTAVEDAGGGSILYYGSSYVRVKGGKVVSYDDVDRRLSIRSE